MCCTFLRATRQSIRGWGKMTIQSERWPSVKTPECLRKCDRDSADHQSDFTSVFFPSLISEQIAMLQFPSLFTVVESKFQWTETAVLCCKTRRLRGRYTSERSSDVVLVWNTCLLHLALPCRFWTMMSSYSSHHFLFPQGQSWIFGNRNKG